jgi:hypothetical protein
MKCFALLIFSFLSAYGITQQIKIVGSCIDKRGKPLESVQIEVNTIPSTLIFSDSLGAYSFSTSAFDTLKIKLSIDEYREIRLLFSANTPKLSYVIKAVQFPIQQERTVQVISSKDDPFEITKLAPFDPQRITGSVERTLTLITAAVSNNELTTNYNVRGGNYDENLVYVNGFMVYRPFLTRSGQQEGMSFIHSALVESVKFSAGGFDAQYGDKLSSVLDIEYKTPKSTKASAMLSLLGTEAHVEQAVSKKFNYLIGARYRSNGYLLNSLPTKGSYNPVFIDGQFLTNYQLNPKLTWSVLGHFSSNDYQFSPQTAETDFGTANEAYSFRIYFDGSESTRFQTMMGGTALKYQVTKNTDLDFYATIFNSNEREYFDIQGQYYINELEMDPSKETYGDSIAVLGIGTFLNHARNQLNATITNIYHQGEHRLYANFKDFEKRHFYTSTIKWGVNYQHDIFTDVLSEWKMIDSAGYSIPQASPNQVELFETIKSELSLVGERATGYAQWNQSWTNIHRNHAVAIQQKTKVNGTKTTKLFNDTISESAKKIALSLGLRSGYTSVNNEFYLTPRAALIFYPRNYMVHNGRITKRNISYRLASGLYYQPPFYREFRTIEGTLNTQVKSQKSFHVVASTDLLFSMWNRENPFKVSGELFYKYLWDVNPYEIENVRTRYYADNNAVAYAYGFDVNIHGEFVEGIESFFKLGILSTKENLKGDSHKEYYNAAGEKIIFGYSQDQTIADSATIFPGYIPRPTDQLFNFGALVQDKMPGLENFTVQMGMQFSTGLPYGPPDRTRYKDTLRLKSYFRVDLGMAYDLIPNNKTRKDNFWGRNFSDALISLEIFNLLGINNVLSKQWIQDVQGKYYAIPNYLTQRRINLKLICKIR